LVQTSVNTSILSILFIKSVTLVFWKSTLK
jgi:hypothetical protein